MKGKSYFAAANTGEGFCNRFDQINDSQKEGFLYILKGGSGTGKSTLMKKVGAYFENLGEEVEYFFCSSDISSLDGVRIAGSNTAIIDGTEPHAAEPAMPGITDVIVNLGQYIGPGVKEHKLKVGRLMRQKKEYFDNAYAYIKAASELDKAVNLTYASLTDKNAVREISGRLWEQMTPLFGGVKNRRLFLSAVAEDGKAGFTQRNNYSKITGLSGNPYAARLILDDIASRLEESSCGYISFGDVLCPDMPQALQTGADPVLLTCEQGFGTECSLESTLIKERYAVKRDGLLYADDSVRHILSLAAKALAEAKACHMEIEKCYIPQMDFSGLDKETEKLIRDIESALN